jgi:hypothetical protein
VFKPGTRVTPDKWPCPAATDEPHAAVAANAAVKQCEDRFWSDAATRVKAGSARRDFADKEDTFQCRFYHGFAVHSPCEDVVKLWVIRVATRDAHDNLVPLANKNAVFAMGDEGSAVLIRSTSNKDGKLFVPVIEGETTMKLQFDAFDAAGTVQPGKDTNSDEDPAESLFVPMFLDGDVLTKMPDSSVDESDDSVKLAARQRLHNLGYGPGDLTAWDDPTYRAALVQFKKRIQGVQNPDDKADSATRDALVAEHGS